MTEQVFVSYSREDHAYVAVFTEKLRELGFSVWHDNRLDAGARFDTEIASALDACSVFVVVMTPASAASHWVRSEVDRAIDRTKFIVPLRLDGDPLMGVSPLHAEDVRGGRMPPPRFFKGLKALIARAAEQARAVTFSGVSRQVLHGTPGESVRCVAWSPKEDLIALAKADRTACIWRPSQTAAQRTLSGHTGNIRSVAWSPEGSFLATGSADHTAGIWNPTNGELVRTLVGHTDEVLVVAWSPDGRFLATAAGDDTARVWTIEGTPTSVHRAAQGGVLAVDWSHDGRYIVTGNDDSTLTVFDVDSGETRETLKGHDGWVYAVAWSPDGRYVASGSADHSARVWEPMSGRLVATLRGHVNSVWSVAWSPDGQFLATGSGDGTARIWDRFTDPEPRYHALGNHSGQVWSVDWSPNGRSLVTASRDGSARVWEVWRTA